MNGYGEYFWTDGRKYIGYYLNDKKDGFGIYIWNEDRAYFGFWKEGKQNGIGRYIFNGENKYGYWEAGKRTIWYENDIEAISLLNGEELDFKANFYIELKDIIKFLDVFKEHI